MLCRREGTCPPTGQPLTPSLLSPPHQRLPRRPGERREAHIGRALGRVGPSMLLCSVSEAVCFFLGEKPLPPTSRPGQLGAGSPPAPVSRHRVLSLLCPPGALTPMPAVRTFALTSGLALILDFLLQMSAFVALVSLDSRRQEVGDPLARSGQGGGGGLHFVERLGVGLGQGHCGERAGLVVPCPTEKQFCFGHFGDLD